MNLILIIVFIAIVICANIMMEKRSKRRNFDKEANVALRDMNTLARKRAHSRSIPMPILPDDTTPVLVPIPRPAGATAGDLAQRNGSAKPERSPTAKPIGQYSQHRRRG